MEESRACFQGNYHGYYTKRPFLRDPRLALLPPDFFADKVVLDVGCNAGWVTCEIAQSFGARRVLGVDIDDTLIRAAWKRRRTLWSLQSSDKDDDDGAHHFPLSCVHAHGLLPVPDDNADAFPHNVAFRTMDWLAHDAVELDTYDVVIAFSITKWIHLHHGDQGLSTLFRRIYDALKHGGVLVLEPQPWSSYANARRLHPKLRENAAKLRFRPRDFPAMLEEIGFEPPRHVGTPGEGGFRRPVDLYVKK